MCDVFGKFPYKKECKNYTADRQTYQNRKSLLHYAVKNQFFQDPRSTNIQFEI